MGFCPSPRHKTALNCCSLAAFAMVLAACSSGPNPGSSRKGKFDPKYGVSASVRVASNRSEFRKGGGHYKIGRPYKVAGRTYVPKHQPNYNKTGKASWYGDDFHGRLTANGEIFDMHALTAAHPTLPLPSYARVTNLKNGRSVIVRINDRGPYAHNRIIDLSKRVAEVLNFKQDGLTNVRVKYIGKARMDGRDARYLEASYRQPGQRVGDDLNAVPSPGLERKAPQRVMVASAATPAQPKKRKNYLLAHVPPLGSPGLGSVAPSPVALAAPAPKNSWAPVDLVGDGYFPPDGKDAPSFAAMAPIQLNYAAAEKRIEAGYAAIDHMLNEAKPSGLQANLRNSLAIKAQRRQRSSTLLQMPAKQKRGLTQPITVGAYQQAYAKRLAEEFALLAAVDMVKQPDGLVALRVVALKEGVGRQDVEDMRQKFRLTGR